MRHQNVCNRFKAYNSELLERARPMFEENDRKRRRLLDEITASWSSPAPSIGSLPVTSAGPSSVTEPQEVSSIVLYPEYDGPTFL